ncbi:hypothetical protein NUU61_008426 [Penicillium alfredii]|uniref:SRR1-like domain-containing protein n=1 Tax=Penicillium alfredii TaxID=1506179 RepID=A0A9W9EL51_9EURO|nr:uncharacterized protein NUU61_008426 [Penicillium alfredii]KAJ5083847.1 hypothetical protein NUU61_008426 [Penicillium alfredii]
MKSLPYLLALFGCILLGVIGSPISTDANILTKRGLEVTDGKKIVLVTKTGSKKDIEAVSDHDKEWIDKYKEKIKGRNLPYTPEYQAYYDYYPLGQGKEPTTAAQVRFYPPKNQDKQQQAVMKTKLDAAKTEWKKTDTYRKFKEALDELSTEVAVSKILGLGCGSLNAINPFSEAAETRNRERSYIQTAIMLTIQEDLKSGPTLILQDPTYGEAESGFLANSASKGNVQVMNDPDGFDAIDDKTIVFNIGGYEAFWYRIDKGPTPVAIITETLDTTIGDKAMLKPQSDLLNKYDSDPKEVAEKDVVGLGRKPTKFWTRACN